MVHILWAAYHRGPKHRMKAERLEPEIPQTHQLRAMLDIGRSDYDPPNSPSTLTDDMRAQMPHSLLVQDIPKEGPPEFIDFGAYVIAHDKVRDKLEDLEPGAHDFFPIKIRDIKTGAEHDSFNLIYLHNAPAIIDHDQTLYGAEARTGGDWGKQRGFSFQWIRKKGGGRRGNPLINFIPGGPDGHHLWRGTVGDRRWWTIEKTTNPVAPDGAAYSDPLNHKLFVSDEFASFIKSEDIRGDQPVRVIEKPASWYYDQREKEKYW